MSNGSKRSSSSFHFFAGMSSGMLSAVLLQPADLLKTRVQQSHQNTLLATIKIIASGPNPIRQFWRGALPSTLRTGCGSAIYFSSLNALRRRVSERGSLFVGDGARAGNGYSSTLPKLSNTANLATGAVARTWAGFIMMPITVLKVRYESNLYSYSSLFSASKDIFRTEGLRGFFAGFGATAVRDAPYAGLYVVFYEQSKKRLSRLATTIEEKSGLPTTPANLSTSASAGINFLSGVMASGLGTTFTNPFDAIKTRIQLMPSRYTNTVQAAKKMFREGGMRSFFDGLGLRIARKAVSSALAWTAYEELLRRAEVSWSESMEQKV
ncbi:mitochondrial carrier [Bimuria novae-zelandiae CBS 107.79]|uniref:Mitochondrial glycine transporter n=1 Tax=Bimuria novae-zelandiae CBS 107.79 TaxID=1447943 RepID=A0A6A5UW22_9PLEO|nr:mitochondrial carrier [Bimuria novae-zelandiae CBS 107.79]